MLPSEKAHQLTGLSEAEASERLRRFGPNELPATRRRGAARLLGEVLREPMLLLLLACGAIYLTLGDLTEALVLLASVFVIIGISLYQSQRTEKALAALRDLSSPRALVRRDGRDTRIAGRDVVPGDLVVLAEGDRVPADGVLLWAMNVKVDESLLTGESEPVHKTTGAEEGEMTRPGGETCFVYSGTLMVAGQAIARVKSTGAATELGRIGSALESAVQPRTKLERDTARLVRILFVGSIVLCLALALFVGARQGDWLEGSLAGLALAMSMIPEEFPVILTIFLALGAWRISQRRVLTRRLPAIEALGAATVLCVDKTGTLTENRMAVSVLASDGRCFEIARDLPPRAPGRVTLPEEFHAVLEYAVLASQQNPFDPMEQAINEAGRRWLEGTEHLHPRWTLVHEYPLSQGLLAMTHVWSSREGREYVIAAKGAPEAIADLCHLSAARVGSLEDEVGRLADEGLRVLGVARAVFRPGRLPAEQHDFQFELVGLIGLVDPVREGVHGSLAECYRAGIRTVMITGDYARTARAVAARVGLEPRDLMATGPELQEMDDAELARRCREVNVFARVVPEQKLRLVRAFQAVGAVVAMTGDGVNDAPALKAADIGVAMGGRGTDVAREAAALVLLDDDFSSIVVAVRLGRRILDNIQKAMAYVLAVHIPIAGLSLLPALFGWPLILLPLHIVFLEMIIDPACSIAFEAEPEEDDVMARPPRNPNSWLLSGATIAMSLMQGAIALAVILGGLSLALAWGYGEEQVRTVGFTTLIVANIGLILAERSSRRTAVGSLAIGNAALLWVATGSLAMVVVVLAWPPARELLRLAAPSAADVGLIALAATIATAGFDMVKRFALRRRSG